MLKASFVKCLFFLTSAVMVASFSFGQTKSKKKSTNNTSKYGNYQNNNQTDNGVSSKYGGYSSDTTNPAPSAYGASNNSVGAIDTTLPIEVINTGSGGLLDSGKTSLRNDAGVELNLVNDRTPMPYENIREDDAVYRVRVWREIDAREKMNVAFRNSAEDDNGSQRFISLLLRSIRDGDVTAFSADNDRFTTPIDFQTALNAFGNGNDTSRKYDRDGNVVGYQVRPKAIDPDSIYKFRIKEEWIFDKESSRLFVRILGIAPVISRKLSNGQTVPNSEAPVWWIYYPDFRKVLAKSQVYNPKNFGSSMTWEDLFESRYFSSYIVKSTIDNPFDLDLAAIYPNNTLFRLLEGERIKDKIFNYEQSLWQY